MIDDNMKPWLIEVNHAPSFATESAFDLKIKTNLIEDTFRLQNLSVKKKNNYINQQKMQF
jgi:tubulin polyglutamylase TTLL6/13